MFGDRIKNLRLKLGYTRDGFAKLLGVTGPAVTRWEHGDSQPSVIACLKLAQSAGFTLDDLLYFLVDETNDPAPVAASTTKERVYLTKALEDIGVVHTDGTVDVAQLHFMAEVAKALKQFCKNAVKNNQNFFDEETEEEEGVNTPI